MPKVYCVKWVMTAESHLLYTRVPKCILCMINALKFKKKKATFYQKNTFSTWLRGGINWYIINSSQVRTKALKIFQHYFAQHSSTELKASQKNDLNRKSVHLLCCASVITWTRRRRMAEKKVEETWKFGKKEDFWRYGTCFVV